MGPSRASIDGGCSRRLGGKGEAAVPALMLAAMGGDCAEVERLLAAAAAAALCLDVDAPWQGRTPLHAAAWGGHEDTLAALLRAGAAADLAEGAHEEAEEDESATSSAGWTPLLAAAVEGHAGCVRRLLAAGAEVDATGPEGQSPLALAAEEGHADVVEELVANGAAVNKRDALEGQTALYTASWLGHEDVVEVLLENGAAVDTPSADGRTPLFAAASEGHEEVVVALLEAGAAVNHARVQGETALYIAAHQGHTNVVDVLLAAGADAALADLEGDVPVSLASKAGHEEVVAMLTERAGPLLTHCHYNTTCSTDQKAAVFRAADAEILRLRSLLETTQREAAAAAAKLGSEHAAAMEQLIQGFPFALASAVNSMQQQRDAALADVRALRAENARLTAAQKTGAERSG